MKSTEQLFQELHDQTRAVNTQAAHERIERNLQSAWKKAHDPAKQKNTLPPLWNWRRWSLVLSTTGIGALALVTTMLTATSISDIKIQSTQNTSQNQNKTFALNTANEAVTIKDIDTSHLLLADQAEVPPQATAPINLQTNTAYTYTDNNEKKELFNESVGLEIQVKQQILDVVHTLRNSVTEHQGHLININYYGTKGVIQIKLPAEQLNAFEEKLKQLDIHNTITVNNYSVSNVSEDIVRIDGYIASAQKRIDAAIEKLNTSGLSSEEKQSLETNIRTQEQYIENQKTSREKTIEKYNLISVQLVVNQYQSFWSGNYSQYDTSTFFGLIKYQAGKVVYSLIHKTSEVVGFTMWLIVYSVIYVPLFFIVRTLARSIRRKIKARKNTTH